MNEEWRTSDERLRRFRFTIYSRPAKGPTLWCRSPSSKTYTTEQAAKLADEELKQIGAEKEAKKK